MKLQRTSWWFLVLEIIGVFAAVFAFNTLAGTAGPEAVQTCRWCSQNAFDEWVRSWLVSNDRLGAAELSHQFSVGVMPIIALVTVLTPVVRGPRRRDGLSNFVMVIAVVVFTFAVVDPVKGLAARERPGFFHGMVTEAADYPSERFLSFFSGDTALAFAIGAAATMIAYLRGYRAAKPIAIASAIGAFIAGVLRIRADMHWATDVMMGGLVGTLVGGGLPFLLHPRHREQEAAKVAVSPDVSAEASLRDPSRPDLVQAA